MTIIVVRNGIMAADSCVTSEDDAQGHIKRLCVKIYRVGIKRFGKPEDAIIGLQGESYPGLVWMDWYCSASTEKPTELTEGGASFGALVLTRHGLYETDQWCRLDKVTSRFHAIGSGSKAAYGALYAGRSAPDAVRIACKLDPYCSLPVKQMSLR